MPGEDSRRNELVSSAAGGVASESSARLVFDFSFRLDGCRVGSLNLCGDEHVGGLTNEAVFDLY